MGNKLSHSSVSRFQQCGKSYEYHYIKRIREIKTSGALLFGSALDTTFNSILTDFNKEAYDPTFEKYKAIFLHNWTQGTINKKTEILIESPNIVYANADFDKVLVEPFFSEKQLNFFKALKYKKESTGLDSLEPNELKLFNKINWTTLREKGYLILETFRKEFLPKITEVLAIQSEIKLKDENGDEVVGFCDAVVKWHDGRTIIIDFKTSSIEYKPDSVLKSQQLTLYVHSLNPTFNTRTAGYVVFRKGILKNKDLVCSVCSYNGSNTRYKTCSNEINGKRCNGSWTEKIRPEAIMNVIIDDIPEQTERIVIENFNVINKAINSGVFVRNFQSCEQPWGSCPFKRLCFNDSMKGLEIHDKT